MADMVLSATSLCKRYGRRIALDGVSFEIPAGTIHGLLGPNGSGKTTALHITGLIKPDSGKVLLKGHDVDDKSSRRLYGFAPDDLPLPSALTGRELLTLHNALRTRDDAYKAELLAEALSISDDLDKLVGEYSHGMQRKVQLIAAVMHDPELLILDEPFRGLDPEAAATVRGLLLTFVAAGGAVLIATHDMLRAERDCDAVTVIADGRLVASGAPADLVASHPHCDNLEDVFMRTTGREQELTHNADLVTLALSPQEAATNR